jgi:FxsC-like protein
MSNYWFFLSYARRNDISYTRTSEGSTPKLVRRLYEELSAEIINGADTGDAKSAEQIGFFDQTGIEPGDKWDDKVAAALRTARVMLCLLSLNYFKSTVSGQEVEVFRSRVESYANAKGIAHPPLIIPILWHAPDRMPALPAVISDLQYTYDAFSKLYAEKGLEFLMRLEKHHDDYQEFLINLAKRLIDVAEQHPLTPLAVCPPLKTVKNAFAPAPAPIAPASVPAVPAGAAPASPLANCGPAFAHFVFVAGQQQELQGVRNGLSAYDQEGRLWKPYLPIVDKSIALFTQRAATDADLQHEVLPLSNALIGQLDIADDTNTIVVLIVDPWTLNVQLYQNCMKSYDKRNLVSCAVLIVWNPDDQQDVLTPDQLQQKVRETFKNSLTNQGLYIRETISSAGELSAELVAAIVEIRRRLDVRAKLFRPIDPGGFATIPQVSTASGAPSGNVS